MSDDTLDRSVAPTPARVSPPSVLTNTDATGIPAKWRTAAIFEASERPSKSDPWNIILLGMQRYEREIDDYTCRFFKQERIDGQLRDVEEIEVRYRKDPKTVYMLWKRNADQAKRVLFIDTDEFVNDKGQKVARVEPAGAIIRLIISDILMPIHGDRAQQTSRRSIDQFGFRGTFALLERYNQLAADHGVRDLRYVGEGEVDGRPTYVIERHLPYSGPDGMWPDARMVLHLDQEWLLPTAVYSYADHAGKELLGSYVMTNVRLNPGLNEKAFDF
jgi:hypothetical protein